VVIEAGVPLNVSASSSIGQLSGQVTLVGFYVNSTSSGTIVFAKTSGGTALSGTITPAIGFHRYPMACPDGLHATIGGTLNVTFFYVPGQA
tara:strand:+ start:94 stop:366 length:273 start_codon:yes stop_codon:yes gene_type:complete